MERQNWTGGAWFGLRRPDPDDSKKSGLGAAAGLRTNQNEFLILFDICPPACSLRQ
jgi:hypothetical protein